MSCPDDIIKLDLPDTKEGCTWRGLTWTIDGVDADNTQYDATLTLAEFIAQDSTGAVVLTLTSATAGQVTINSSAANSWSVTAEPRILSLTSGFYPFTFFTTDSSGVRAPRWEGTFRIHD